MPRPIVVILDNKNSEFSFKKLERRKLYGSKKRIALDKDGHQCKKASITEDGAFLLKTGMSVQGYFDNSENWIPNKELVGLLDGVVVEKNDSTLGVPQQLEAVEPSVLLDCRIQSTYLLDEQNIDEALAKALDEGQLFRFCFNYRADYHAETGFLLKNPEGYFALVGIPAESTWQAPSAPPPIDDDEDELDDDLDFEMF
jgi:hypothetical protein